MTIKGINKKIYYLINEELEKFLLIEERAKTIIYKEFSFGVLTNQEEQYNSSNDSFESKAQWNILNRQYRGYKEAFENELNEEKIMYDSVFGLVKEKDDWLSFYKYSHIFDRVVEINISDNINDSYKNTFQNFLKIENKIKTKIKKGILDYYNQEYLDPTEEYDNKDEIEEFSPKINSIDDLEKYIYPANIVIGEEEIDIYINCSWDVEHGLKISIINEKIDYIGQP